MKKLALANILLFMLIHCGEPTAQKERTPPDDTSNKKNKSVIKPPSIFSDTLTINSKAAVFYYPDSNQLNTIRAGLDTLVFDAVMHENYYQVRFAHTAINNFWSKLKIIEAKKARYLLFIKADKSRVIIDLDKKLDPYGLFLFDARKDPAQMDMMNIENQIGFYFADAQKTSIPK